MSCNSCKQHSAAGGNQLSVCELPHYMLPHSDHGKEPDGDSILAANHSMGDSGSSAWLAQPRCWLCGMLLLTAGYRGCSLAAPPESSALSLLLQSVGTHSTDRVGHY